jgi:hypothetical protein
MTSRSMRGSLAIEQVILLILALVVLAAVVMFLFGTYKPSQQGLDLETAKSNACQTYVSIGCEGDGTGITVRNFDADQNGVIGNTGTGKLNCKTSQGDNLYMLSKCYYGTTAVNSTCRCG